MTRPYLKVKFAENAHLEHERQRITRHYLTEEEFGDIMTYHSDEGCFHIYYGNP